MPKPTETVPAPGAKFPVLVSYAHVRDNPALFGRLVAHPGVELLLDSGAFTALNAGYTIKLDDYMTFLEQWHDKLFGYMALDVLGDPAATATNLRVMHDAGFKPVPVHVRGDDRAKMDELYQSSDWVALGGFRRPRAGQAPLSYVKHKMRWAAGRKVHWLGYTRTDAIAAFAPFSADCSSWASGARWGTTVFYDGGITTHTRKSFESGGFTSALNAGELRLLDELGLPADAVFDSALHRAKPGLRVHYARGAPPPCGAATDYSGHVPFMISAFSYVKLSRAIRETIGTRLFLAVTDVGNQGELLLWMIERTAK